MPCRLTRRKMGHKQRGVSYHCHDDFYAFLSHSICGHQGIPKNWNWVGTNQTRTSNDKDAIDDQNRTSHKLPTFSWFSWEDHILGRCDSEENTGRSLSGTFKISSLSPSFSGLHGLPLRLVKKCKIERREGVVFFLVGSVFPHSFLCTQDTDEESRIANPENSNRTRKKKRQGCVLLGHQRLCLFIYPSFACCLPFITGNHTDSGQKEAQLLTVMQKSNASETTQRVRHHSMVCNCLRVHGRRCFFLPSDIQSVTVDNDSGSEIVDRRIQEAQGVFLHMQVVVTSHHLSSDYIRHYYESFGIVQGIVSFVSCVN